MRHHFFVELALLVDVINPSHCWCDFEVRVQYFEEGWLLGITESEGGYGAS